MNMKNLDERYKSIEKNIEVKKIVLCWLFNVIAAVVVFATSMLTLGSPVFAILHTFVAWAITLTASIVYWLIWIQNKIKGKQMVKIGASSVVILFFLLALVFVFRTLGFIVYIINM